MKLAMGERELLQDDAVVCSVEVWILSSRTLKGTTYGESETPGACIWQLCADAFCVLGEVAAQCTLLCRNLTQ